MTLTKYEKKLLALEQIRELASENGIFLIVIERPDEKHSMRDIVNAMTTI